MNTINNPLILTFHQGKQMYVVNKPNEQSGKYVDLKLAEEMLEAIYAAQIQIEYLHSKFQETGTGNQILSNLESVILKAKG